ncbi:MAG: WYL domain-containing protein [candidate division Zixibacteria bacterium]|nr:WYL domain-containing protein [candidate division Zixibacteria bacterium]
MDDHYLQSFDFVAFDTETTGLWAPANRIVELGAVKFRLGSQTSERFQELVNPGRKIPLETVRIHKITDSMVKDADPIKPVLERFIEFCGPDAVLIAHNAPFDISFVGCELDRSDLPLPANPVLDTVDLFRKYRPGLDSYSLLSLARKFKLGRSQNHRAADDAAMVWKLFSMVAEDFPYMADEKEFKRRFQLYSMKNWKGDMPPLPSRFADFLKAIKKGKRMEVVYASNGRPPESRIIQPLRLHALKSAHYVAAYCEEVNDERTFRLDRMRSFRIL